MTHSTKQALVEHVARVIDPCVWSIWDGSDQWRKIQNNHRRNVSREVARAAIRATLEWARDNPTDEMISRGQEQIEDRIDKPVYPEDPTIIEITPATRECFRAMLSALIQELDTKGGER